VTYIEGDDHRVSAFLGGIKENLQRFKFGGADVIAQGREVQKRAVPLASLLDKHHVPHTIDYASFDMEGSELTVLEGFPFHRYRFLALSLECDGSIWDRTSAVLSANGYREVKNPFNQDKPWERYWLHRSMG
jgi:hypothetical protein